MLLSFLILLFSLDAFAVPTVPSVPNGFVPAGNVRLFVNQGDLSYYASVGGAAETDNRQFEEVMVGAYYHVFDFLKFGAFYNLAYGLRYDQDWVSNSGQWSWVNTNGRGESFVVFDVTPSTVLDFLPGKNWVGELKLRNYYDFYNQQDTLFVRPGITYFWLKDDQPYWNFFFQFELDFPLNYSIETINEEWLYFGALHHFTSFLDAGGYTALNWQTWGNTQAFLNAGGAPYSITSTSWVVSLLAIFNY